VITGELQTAADAAALAGARTLQFTDGPSADAAVDAAVMAFVGSTNRADGKQILVGPSAVRLAHWGPGMTVPDYAYSPSRPNAVVVELGATAVGDLTRFVGSSLGIPLTRTAIAWVANLGAYCVKPWSLPYSALAQAVSGGGAGAPLDPEQFLAFTQQTQDARTFTFVPVPFPSQPNDGVWDGFNLPTSLGAQAYGDAIAGCNDTQLTTTNMNGVIERPQDQYVTLTGPAIDRLPQNGLGTQLCAMTVGNAGCYPPGSSVPGVSIRVAWGNTSGSTVDFGFVGAFVLVCYFREDTDACPVTPKPGYFSAGYPRGTIIGYLSQIKSRTLEGEPLGNIPSNMQRIVLVN
jgi:hypothetical protein